MLSTCSTMSMNNTRALYQRLKTDRWRHTRTSVLTLSSPHSLSSMIPEIAMIELQPRNGKILWVTYQGSKRDAVSLPARSGKKRLISLLIEVKHPYFDVHEMVGSLTKTDASSFAWRNPVKASVRDSFIVCLINISSSPDGHVKSTHTHIWCHSPSRHWWSTIGTSTWSYRVFMSLSNSMWMTCFE